MKTFRLLIVSLLLATSASAQHHRGERRGGDYSPTVYLISVHEVDTIYNCGGCAAQQAAALNRMAVGNATQDYIDTHRPGFQQTEKPPVRVRLEEQPFLVLDRRLREPARGL